MPSHSWYRRLGLEHPIIQAGMGGGIARSPLVAAVARSGALGTLGLLAPEAFAAEIRLTRELAPERPFAVNLLMPYVRHEHWRICLALKPAAVSLFFGFDRRRVTELRTAGIFVLHQVGGREQAQRALDEGADGLILQGIEAGGHIIGKQKLAELFDAIAPITAGVPLIAAGGIYDRHTAAQAMQRGFHGVSAGTRFLLTHESGAHPEYKARLLAAKETMLTRLFGFSWPAPHRVVPNAATRRRCEPDGQIPPWLRLLNAAAVPARRLHLSPQTEHSLIGRQRPAGWLFTPAALVDGMANRLADATALYAGTGVSAMTNVLSASEVVRELACGLGHKAASADDGGN